MMKFLPMNFNTSSMSHTGAAHAHTSAHSFASSGTMLKMVASAGTYRIKKCNAKDENIATISHGFIHGGMTKREMSYASERRGGVERRQLALKGVEGGD